MSSRDHSFTSKRQALRHSLPPTKRRPSVSDLSCNAPPLSSSSLAGSTSLSLSDTPLSSKQLASPISLLIPLDFSQALQAHSESPSLSFLQPLEPLASPAVLENPASQPPAFEQTPLESTTFQLSSTQPLQPSILTSSYLEPYLAGSNPEASNSPQSQHALTSSLKSLSLIPPSPDSKESSPSLSSSSSSSSLQFSSSSSSSSSSSLCSPSSPMSSLCSPSSPSSLSSSPSSLSSSPSSLSSSPSSPSSSSSPPSPSPFLSLPPELVSLIFEDLNLSDVVSACLVCKEWWDVGKRLWIPSFQQKRVREIGYKVMFCLNAIDELLVEWEERTQGQYHSRIAILGELLAEINEELSFRLDPQVGKVTGWMYPRLLNSLFRILVDIKRICESLRGLTVLPHNFDTCAYSVRKIFYQLCAIYPLDRGTKVIHLTPQDQILTDPIALTLWRQIFGLDVYLVSRTAFYTFLQQLVTTMSSEVEDFVTYLLNYPLQRAISIYSAQCLLSMFGPAQELGYNIQTYALTRGFVGVQNVVTATEKLEVWRMRGFDRGILLRLSGTNPQSLTISYVTANGEIWNIRQSRPLSEFIEPFRDARSDRRIPEYLNCDKVVHTGYASYCRDHSDAYMSISMVDAFKPSS